MRKALLFLAIVVCGTAFAQQAQSKVYCEIVGTSKMFSKKLTIEVDFGQESTLFSRETLVDENGKPIVFNSMVDAMNYMEPWAGNSNRPMSLQWSRDPVQQMCTTGF